MITLLMVHMPSQNATRYMQVSFATPCMEAGNCLSFDWQFQAVHSKSYIWSHERWWNSHQALGRTQVYHMVPTVGYSGSMGKDATTVPQISLTKQRWHKLFTWPSVFISPHIGFAMSSHQAYCGFPATRSPKCWHSLQWVWWWHGRRDFIFPLLHCEQWATKHLSMRCVTELILRLVGIKVAWWWWWWWLSLVLGTHERCCGQQCLPKFCNSGFKCGSIIFSENMCMTCCSSLLSPTFCKEDEEA